MHRQPKRKIIYVLRCKIFPVVGPISTMYKTPYAWRATYPVMPCHEIITGPFDWLSDVVRTAFMLLIYLL